MQYLNEEKSDEEEIAVTGHVVSIEEAAEMEAELQREARERGEQGEPEENQMEDLPSQPPPSDAKPREGELGDMFSCRVFLPSGSSI